MCEALQDVITSQPGKGRVISDSARSLAGLGGRAHNLAAVTSCLTHGTAMRTRSQNL